MWKIFLYREFDRSSQYETTLEQMPIIPRVGTSVEWRSTHPKNDPREFYQKVTKVEFYVPEQNIYIVTD